jgi:iron-sulfur cluster repair protein YtfE (RIC family)
MTDKMDAVELLLADHRMIDEFVERLDSTDDPNEIRDLFVRIVDEFAAHEAAEHEVVFPVLRAVEGMADDDMLGRRIGEHEELNTMLAEMRDLAPDGFGFTKRASALLLEIKGHFALEEETVFEQIRAALSADESSRLSLRILEVKERVRAVATRR